MHIPKNPRNRWKSKNPKAWQPLGNQMAHRIGKDRIGEDRRGEVRGEESVETATCQQVVDLYHSICVSYPSVKTLSEAKKKAIRARLKVYSLEDFRKMFEKAEGSAFLKGANNRNWSATFDWLLKESNMVKVLEGNYDNKTRSPAGAGTTGANKFNNFPQRQYDYGTLEEMLLAKE